MAKELRVGPCRSTFINGLDYRARLNHHISNVKGGVKIDH